MSEYVLSRYQTIIPQSPGGSGGAFMFNDGSNALSTAFGNLVTAATAATARTALGLGTGNSPTFTGLTLSSMTQGSVLFAGAGGVVSQNNLALNWADSTKLFSINANTVAAASPIAGSLAQITGADSANARLDIDTYGTGVAPGLFFRAARGTLSIPSAVQTDDLLGTFSFSGYGATAFSAGRAGYRALAAQNWNDSFQGTYLALYTTPLNSTSQVERARLLGNGNFGILNTVIPATLSVGTTAATAQTFNTFTDASNYENAYMGDWGVTANVATYGTGKAGIGSTRNIQFVVGGTRKADYGISVAKWTFADGADINGVVNFNQPGVAPGLAVFLGATSLTSGNSVSYGLGSAISTGNSGFLVWNKAATSYVSLETYAGANPVQLNGNTLRFQSTGVTKLDYGETNAGVWTFPGGTLLATSASLTNGAAAQIATMTNGPAAGNPTKWVPINDNGTTRYIPAW